MAVRIRQTIKHIIAKRKERKQEKTRKPKPVKEKPLPKKKKDKLREYFKKKYEEYIRKQGHQGEFGPGKEWGPKK